MNELKERFKTWAEEKFGWPILILALLVPLFGFTLKFFGLTFRETFFYWFFLLLSGIIILISGVLSFYKYYTN